MPQFLKLMLYNEINLSVRFQDSSCHVWEHSRFIIGTVIKQSLVHKEALLGKNKIMYSALFCKIHERDVLTPILKSLNITEISQFENPMNALFLIAILKAWSEL